MTDTMINPARSWPAWGARLVERAAATAGRAPWLGLLLFSGAYAVVTLAHSLDKALWFDELFTFYISRLPSIQERIPVAMHDGHPPFFYLLTNASMRLFGELATAARLPEMIGVWLMCVSLFFFVRRRCPAIYAYLALVFPLATVIHEYSYEARPYGIVLGMAGVSLLAWQSVTEGRRHRLGWLALLAISLGIGVSSHFFGIQILLPLAVGEAVRTWTRRKIDWGVVAAMVCGALPVGILVAIARRAVATQFTTPAGPMHTAASPSLAALAGFYAWMLQPLAAPLALAFVLLVLGSVLRIDERTREDAARPPLPLHEWAALATYLLIPAGVLIVTALTTDSFQGRYAIGAVVGLGGLFPCMLSSWCRGRALVPLAFTASIAFLWAAHTPNPPLQWQGRTVELTAQSRIYPKQDNLPIVVSGWGLFPQWAHYSTPDVASRLYYLADLQTSQRTHRPIAEASLSGARRALPGHVVDYCPFVRAHRNFWVYVAATGDNGWVPGRLVADGWKLDMKMTQGPQMMLLATRE